MMAMGAMNRSPHATATREVGARRWSADLPAGVKNIVAMMGRLLLNFADQPVHIRLDY
jgi:hypothetical protein